MDREGLTHLLTWVQDGVVSRRQILDLGGSENDITRMRRRRELVQIHPGVYVTHTGPPTREQLEWAAVLFFWPAALTHESALPNRVRTGVVHVATSTRRNRRSVAGVRVHRIADFDNRVDWRQAPPRTTHEDAVIDVAAAANDRFESFRLMADACQTRQTSAAKIAATLRSRRRVAGKAFLLELLSDLAAGACSVLEREWLIIERTHGLPVEDNRQTPARVNGRSAYRDVDHSRFGLLIELDGRAFHDNAAARDKDFTRDLAAAVDSELTTIRLTYGQVLRDGCATVRQVAALLERRGWPGPFLQCPNCPKQP